MRLVGVFGGTFDPVHYGHLETARDIYSLCGLDELRFVPNRIPPHRQSPWLSSEQRLDLLRAAVEDYPEIIIDERELKREQPSYMVETLASLKEESPASTFCLIMGADALVRFQSWRQPERILELAHLIVTRRPGIQWQELAELDWARPLVCEDRACLRDSEAGRILLESVSLLDISATKIREHYLRGDDISSWVPERIVEMLDTFKRKTGT